MVQDILKRPVKVGDTILVKGYYSALLDTITTVTKVNKDTISIEVKAWDYAKQQYYLKPMKRDSNSFIVINEQLEYNRATYPEHYI